MKLGTPLVRALILAMALVVPATAGAESFTGHGGTDFGYYPISGRIYSIDYGSYSVKSFVQDGSGLASFGGPGQTAGLFSGPMGVAADGYGDVYVVDGASPVRIEKWSAGGTYITEWGSAGCGNGQFNAPRAIASGGSGSGPVIYVGDQNCPAPPQARIQQFSPSGTFLTSFGTAELQRVSGMSTASDGSLWVLEGKVHKIFHYNYSGGLLGSFPVQAFDTPGDYPQDIWWASDGVYVVNGPAKRVEKYSEAGALLGTLALDDNYQYLLRLPDSVFVAFGAKALVTKINTTSPFPSLEVAPNPTGPLQNVTFDASGSQMPFGTITTYEFDTDGNGTYDVSQTTPTYTRSYTQRTNFTASLRVTGSTGTQATTTQPILVGPAGISVNGGAQFTNTPNVTISVVWPLNAATMLLANDGGFTPATALPVASSAPWVLNSSGPERLPKTVYSRFSGGTAGNETYQDDIILDQTPPVIGVATATPARVSGAAARTAKAKKAKGFRVKLKATDNISGVATYQITTNKTKPGAEIKYASSFKYTGKLPAFVRVKDNAGNFSGYKKLQAPKKAKKKK
jgi:hypothetical protein